MGAGVETVGAGAIWAATIGAGAWTIGIGWALVNLGVVGMEGIVS
jgi:hypothetical protein